MRRGRPRPPPTLTPLDDVYNRDALAGRTCPQPLSSSLDVIDAGDGTCPPYSDAVSVVPPPIPSSSSSDRVCGGRLLARPSTSAVPGTTLVAAFAVHNALKKHRHRHRTLTFSGKHRPTPTDLEISDTVTTLTGRLDKLPETRHFYAKREFSGDLRGLRRQHCKYFAGVITCFVTHCRIIMHLQ